jgi:hypothetical protein
MRNFAVRLTIFMPSFRGMAIAGSSGNWIVGESGSTPNGFGV